MSSDQSAGDAGHRAPAPSADPKSVLFGRDFELAQLSALLDRAITGKGGACVISGDAGIGKSSLLRVIVERARERSIAVHSTRGVDSESHLPFAGLHRLLAELLSFLDELGAAQQRNLRTAFGFEQEQSADPFQIALSALELLTFAAADGALLIVADDAQLLDAPTVDVLTFVARRLAADAILVLFAVRDEALNGTGLEELHLAPLDSVASTALIRERAPNLAPSTQARVLELAAGNPLALMELPTSIQAIDQDAGTSSDLLPLSARLERTFASRTKGLSEETRALLLATAIDPSCGLQELLRAAGKVLGHPLFVEAIDGAVAVGLVEVDATAHVRFRHPLMASAIYGSASFAERVRVHEALADTLSHRPDQQVWHRASAALGIDEPLSGELEQSAARALQRGAPTMAVSTLRRASELTADLARRAALLLRAAELAGELGQHSVAAQLASSADATNMGPVEQARLISVGEVVAPGDLSDAGRLRSLVEAARQAQKAGARDVAVDVLFRAASRCFKGGAADGIGGPIVAALDRTGLSSDDPRRLAILAFAQPVTHGAEALRLLTDRATDALDPAQMRYLGGAAMTLGDFPTSSAYLANAAEAFRAEGRLGLLARTLGTRSWGQLFVGEWDAVRSDLDEANRLAAETGEQFWETTTIAGTALLAAFRGDCESAERIAVEVQAIPFLAGVRFTLAATQHARGVAALFGGRPDEAFDDLIRIFDPTDATHHPIMSTWALADLADAAVAAGRVDSARSVVQGVERRAGKLPSPMLQIGLRYVRAVLAEDSAAERNFEAALAVDLSAWPVCRSRLLLAHGIWLRRHRRSVDARSRLREARDNFDAVGANPWAERAREELRASGESSRRAAAYARDRLTPQELQIATMAASGMTNREIGRRLYLSPRTISTHLYRVFPKVGITSRSQLGEVLASLGESQ